MGNKNLHFETKRIHSGYSQKDHFNAVNTPIYQTAGFDLGDIDRARRLWTGSEDGGIYSRVGNPTVGVLEERISNPNAEIYKRHFVSTMRSSRRRILLLCNTARARRLREAQSFLLLFDNR